MTALRSRIEDQGYASADEMVQDIKSALAAGEHLTARILAMEGAERYLGNTELQRLAHVLAPPRIVQAQLPSVPSLGASQAWLQEHATEYAGRWVALRADELVASAETANELKQQIGSEKGLLLTKVL